MIVKHAAALAVLAGACQFANAADCMEQAVTTVQMQSCAQETFDAANAEYAREYRKLTKALNARERQQLNASQKSFLEYQRRACELETGRTSGGSIAGVAVQLCQARLTRWRTGELKRLTDCQEGDVSCRRP